MSNDTFITDAVGKDVIDSLTGRFIVIDGISVPADYQNPDWTIEPVRETREGVVIQFAWHGMISAIVQRNWNLFESRQKAILAAGASKDFTNRVFEEYQRALRIRACEESKHG